MNVIAKSVQASRISLSVVICTFNRADLLDRTLTSLVAQTAREAMEVVIVDNNSADATPQVLQRWCSQQTLRLTSVVECMQGLSYARNTGVAQSGGGIVAFLDDDVWAAPNWAARILQVFADKPEVDCLGGPVDADWEILPPPSWVNKELLFSVGVGHYGTKAKFLTGKEYPIGANMAFRAEVFKEVGGFDPRLGRVGADLLSCEEVEFIERLRARGKCVYYDPEVKAAHFVPACRACKAYFLARRASDGRSIAVWEGLRGGKWLFIRNLVFRLGLTLIRDIPGYTLTVIAHRDRSFTYACRLAKMGGYLKQARQMVAKGIDGTIASNSNRDS